MTIRSTGAAVVLGVTAACALLAGCSSTAATGAGGQPSSAAAMQNAAAPSASAPAASPTPVVKDVAAGNCTLYSRSDAATLLGAVNFNNKALDIGTDGGTTIDQCSYLDLQGVQNLQGVSYAVVRYDSAGTAFTEATKVQTEMLGDAAEHNWPVQSLTAPVPGAGQLLGGYGTKTDQGVTYTIAVVGTNVGPYLVAALGASTEGPDKAKNFALTVFQALAAKVS